MALQKTIAAIDTGDVDGGIILTQVFVDPGLEMSDEDIPPKRWRALRSEISWISKELVGAVIESQPTTPSKLEVEFGVALAVQSGKVFAMLAEVNGGATVTVRATWDKTDELRHRALQTGRPVDRSGVRR